MPGVVEEYVKGDSLEALQVREKEAYREALRVAGALDAKLPGSDRLAAKHEVDNRAADLWDRETERFHRQIPDARHEPLTVLDEEDVARIRIGHYREIAAEFREVEKQAETEAYRMRAGIL